MSVSHDDLLKLPKGAKRPASTKRLYPRQAITTKFLGATNFRGSRIKVSCQAGSMVVSWDYALGVTENHGAAIVAMIRKLDWCGEFYPGKWVMGDLPGGAGYVATYQSDDTTLEV